LPVSFWGNIKRGITAVYFNNGRLCCFCDIGSRQLDIYFTKKEQGVIMWLIVFMAGCSLPLIVMGCVCLWREKQWEKYNQPKDA
jgi:hypothetical protein